MRIVLDACSFVHFLASGEQNILVQWAEAKDAQLTVTETVDEEIVRTSKKPKFAGTGAERAWGNLRRRVQVVSEDLATVPMLQRAMVSLHQADLQMRGALGTRQPLSARLRKSEDLGEFVTVAYAIAFAQEGHEVFVVCDDRLGRDLVRLARNILHRDGVDYRRIHPMSTRKIVTLADPTWRRNGRSADETIAAMETIEPIPDWSD